MTDITTIAGDGTDGFNGDGEAAVKALLDYPDGVAVDSAGNLYIADTSNHRVRKVDAQNQTISTVAGDGKPGDSGDDGPAVKAQLNHPEGVTVGSDGNLYIADTFNHRVRKVDVQNGTITTVAGTGTPGPLGDDGPAVMAQLNRPKGVALDASGDLYIADSSNHRVRKVDRQIQTIVTVAGSGTAGFSGDDEPATEARLYAPEGVAVDSGGNLYIADSSNHRVRKVDAQNQTITTLTGTGAAGFSGDNGPAAKAKLNHPEGVAVDFGGNLYIADAYNNRVRKVGGVSPITRFSVQPTKWPEVTLSRDGATGYPGVRIHGEKAGPVPPQTVRVTLPAGKGLQFVPEGDPGYQLTVWDASGTETRYDGVLSPDKQSLTFKNVHLGLPGKGSETSAWVAVRAFGDAPLGDTSLLFSVGDQSSDSTLIHVVARFSVSPGGPVTLVRAGDPGYPGVELRAGEDGHLPPQRVTVTFLEGTRGLRFTGLLVTGFMQGSQWQQVGSYQGTLSPNGRTVDFENVGLALSGAGSKSGLLVEVKASADAPLGDRRVSFQVGGQTSDSSLIHVVHQ